MIHPPAHTDFLRPVSTVDSGVTGPNTGRGRVLPMTEDAGNATCWGVTAQPSRGTSALETKPLANCLSPRPWGQDLEGNLKSRWGDLFLGGMEGGCDV